MATEKESSPLFSEKKTKRSRKKRATTALGGRAEKRTRREGRKHRSVENIRKEKEHGLAETIGQRWRKTKPRYSERKANEVRI